MCKPARAERSVMRHSLYERIRSYPFSVTQPLKVKPDTPTIMCNYTFTH